MVTSHWRVFTDSSKQEVAKRVIADLECRTARRFQNVHVDAYHKGGHVVTFDIEHNEDDWCRNAYDIIVCSQNMATGWSIAGQIEEDFDLMTTKTSIVSVKMITCSCARPGTANAK